MRFFQLKIFWHYLNPSGQSSEFVGGEFHRGHALGNQGHDRSSSMTSNDRAVDISGVKSLQFRNKSVGPHDVQGCHAEDLVGVEFSGPLEHLARDGNR